MTEIVEKYIKKAPSVGEKGDLPIWRFVDLVMRRFEKRVEKTLF